MVPTFSIAPELRVSQWFNESQPFNLPLLRGRVVVMYFFQMLCPGCVTHSIPQAKAVHAAFPSEKVAVIGVHSVFEHHEAMAPHALQAFMYEYRIVFPVAVDAADKEGPIPLTMQAYGLRGTPSLIVIDHEGRIRLQHFGRFEDLELGTLIGQLSSEANAATASCDSEGCYVPPLDWP